MLDNTVTMAWCFAEEATAFAEALLSRPSSVPAAVFDVSNSTKAASLAEQARRPR